jgi:hypothetical protein
MDKRASHKDILRLFPGLQAHTVLEVQEIGASADDLEVALQLLNASDEPLVEAGRREDPTVHRVLSILSQDDIDPFGDED